MTGGFSLGRLFGIRIQVDWSWIFIFLLVSWNLGSAFTTWHPNWGPALVWGIAVVAALLFFASVLAHELAHALVAKTQGLPVRRITLFLFGGVADIQREPPSPRAEFLIAVVGPLTSIVLGILFLLLHGALAPTANLQQIEGYLASLDPLSTILLWLGPVNIAVGIFNLVPGFPLDGGRILRSGLWAATKNLRKATRWASLVGQAIGWLMIIAGVSILFGADIPFFGSGFVSGLWLAFIGWFLNSAAQQSYRQLVIRDVLDGVQVMQMMRRDVPTVHPDTSISSLVHERIMQSDWRAFPVTDGERLVGLVCLDDIRKVPNEAWNTTAVRQIMTPEEKLVTTTPVEEAADALQKLGERDVDQLPVLQNGSLVGLLRRQDILKWLRIYSEERPEIIPPGSAAREA